MADQDNVLADRLSVPLILDYVDGLRFRKTHHVILRSLSWRVTEIRAAARVNIECISRETNKPKTFHAQKILSITDPSTGEIHDDPAALLSGIITSAGGKQPPEWPDEIIRARCPIPEIDDSEHLTGWAFGVHKAFLPALDMRWETIRHKNRSSELILTEGIPRAYHFDAGDMLYSPQIPPEPWGAQVLKLRRGVQVVASTPDTIINRRKSNGTIEADIWDFVSGQIENNRRVALPQEQFAELLRTGLLP